MQDFGKTFAALSAEIAAIDAKAAPLVERGKLIAGQIAELQAEQRAISEQLRPYRGPDYAEKRRLLGQLAVAMGGKRLTAEALQ